jgi:hypothetical protein
MWLVSAAETKYFCYPKVKTKLFLLDVWVIELILVQLGFFPVLETKQTKSVIYSATAVIFSQSITTSKFSL